jgi:hypothetical protein
MNAKSISTCVGLVVLVLLSGADAAPVRPLSLRELVEQADVVAMGTLLATSDVGSTSVGEPNGAVQARSMVGDLHIDRVFKGRPEITSLQFRFVQPEVFVGYAGVAAGSYRIFFLKRTGDRYELVSPYFPSVVALSGGVVGSGRAALDTVIEAVARVVESATASTELRREAIHALWGVKDPLAAAAMRLALRHNDPAVHLTAAAALLVINDVAAMPIAEEALLRPSVDQQSELLHNLRVGISQGLRDPGAVPALGRLLGADTETRRAASSALRRMRNQSVLRVLAIALEDADVSVRHNAVMGFAETTGQTAWGPHMATFQSDQEHYLQHWRDWSRNR